jgi:hypothetical protein
MANQFTIASSTKAILRWGPPTIVTLVGTAALTVLIAAPRAEAASRQAHPERITEATAPRAAGAPIMAIVSLESQQITIYDADGWILRAPVSSGQKGRETPAGVFSVIQRKRSITRISTTMPPCLTCSASLGRASPCTAVPSRDMRRRTVASACPTASPSACSMRRGSGCA